MSGYNQGGKLPDVLSRWGGCWHDWDNVRGLNDGVPGTPARVERARFDAFLKACEDLGALVGDGEVYTREEQEAEYERGLEQGKEDAAAEIAAAESRLSDARRILREVADSLRDITKKD